MTSPRRLVVAVLLVSGFAVAADPVAAATVEERTVTIERRADGSVRELHRWTVRLDSDGDFARWSPFPIALDENRELVRVKGAALPAGGGKPLSVGRRHRDRVGAAGGGVLHSSTEVELVEFPSVGAGSRLQLEYEVEERPWFPSGSLELALEDAVAALRVELRGSGLRWRLAGPGSDAVPEGLQVSEQGSAVVITGALPALRPLPYAPSQRGPVLRYAWGGEGSDDGWNAVGRWYSDLLAPVPRGSDSVRATARQLTAGAADRREAVTRLLRFVRRDVRYVAVEVGVGGYRPGTPEQVLARRWGDCKDKALLLVDLLAAIDVPGRLVLVRADESGVIDPRFAAPDQFNHAIAAVPVSAVEASPALVAGGWAFLDATQEDGGLEWIHPAVAGQQGLVVGPVTTAGPSAPAGGELVAIPQSPAGELDRLVVDLTVAADGAASGQATLEVRGSGAAALAQVIAAADRSAVVAAGQRVLAQLLPGATLDAVEVASTGDGSPRGSLSARVRFAGIVAGSSVAPSLILPGAPATPPASELEGRREPMVLSPGVVEAEWRLRLPWRGCRLEDAAVAVDGPLGAFEQRAAIAGDQLTLTRRAEVRQRQALPSDFAALQALALAEQRTLRRRLRLGCGG